MNFSALLGMFDFGVNTTLVVRRQRRKKQLTLTVRPGGRVFLTIPFSFSLNMVKRFLMSKEDWIRDACKRVLDFSPRLLHQGGKDEYVATKEVARQCIVKRVEYFQKIYEVSYRRISIRNQRTRFGSCSAQGNLSFNYRLIFLPASLRDYVVVHELCHLKELNHSRKFWALVAETIPDYRKMRRELQTFSRSQSRS